MGEELGDNGVKSTRFLRFSTCNWFRKFYNILYIVNSWKLLCLIVFLYYPPFYTEVSWVIISLVVFHLTLLDVITLKCIVLYIAMGWRRTFIPRRGNSFPELGRCPQISRKAPGEWTHIKRKLLHCRLMKSFLCVLLSGRIFMIF
jgi:hypothetical protein